MKLVTVAEMVLRDLDRRRAVLGLLFLVPLAFYVARRDQTGQAIRFASLGLGWGASTAGLFAGNAAKAIEPRLRLIGYSWAQLFFGRLVPLGMLIGAAVPRDLEGTLVLIAFIGLQMLIDPAKNSAKLLPFWSSREIGTYAVDPVGSDYLDRGLTHGPAVASGLTFVALVLTAVHLRRRRHVRIMPQVSKAGAHS